LGLGIRLKNDCGEAIGLGVGFCPGKDEQPDKKIIKASMGWSFE
jgi:hypothetical protein